MAIEATTLALARAYAKKLVDEYMQAHPPVPGADGYTPVKGVDYFTDDDKTELVDAVLAALPASEGAGY